MSADRPECTWPRCHRAPNPCFSWCKCSCHVRVEETPELPRLLAEAEERGAAKVRERVEAVLVGIEVEVGSDDTLWVPDDAVRAALTEART